MEIGVGTDTGNFITNPLGLLNDCHRRIERFLNLLMRVALQGQSSPLSDEQRGALEVAVRYFKEAAPKHKLDEEESLFPRMRQAGGPLIGEVLGRLEELEEDHQVLDASHREVETLVRRWLNQGRLGAEDAHRLNQRLGDMSAIYQRHIEVEETEVFPVARGSLDQSQLEMVGREMASRRGLDFDGLRSLDGSA